MKTGNTLKVFAAGSMLAALGGCSEGQDTLPANTQGQQIAVCTDTQIKNVLDQTVGDTNIAERTAKMTQTELNDQFIANVEALAKISLRAMDLGQGIIANPDNGLAVLQELPSDSAGKLVMKNFLYPKDSIGGSLCSISTFTLGSSSASASTTIIYGDHGWSFKSSNGNNTMEDGSPLTAPAVTDLSMARMLFDTAIPSGAVPQATYSLGPQSQSA